MQAPLEPSRDDRAGMAWWNGLNRAERNHLAEAAKLELGHEPSPKEVWDYFRGQEGNSDALGELMLPRRNTTQIFVHHTVDGYTWSTCSDLEKATWDGIDSPRDYLSWTVPDGAIIHAKANHPGSVEIEELESPTFNSPGEED